MREQYQDFWWNHDLIGFEDEESEENEEGEDDAEDNDAEDSETEDEGEGDEESDDADEDEDEDDDSKKGNAGLKSALRKERMARKRAERQLRKFREREQPPKGQKKKTDKEEESEDKDESSEELAAAKAQGERLAKRLKDNAVDTMILRHAERFKDPEDLLRLIDRADIDIDQDDDDPSEIEVDEESVADAVKALAKKKPHLLKTKEERVASGSKFGGRRKKSNQPSDESLREKFPALRR